MNDACFIFFTFQESVNDLSTISQIDGLGGQPVFSTPVRASFRTKGRQIRPSTAILLEEAKTPMKREGKLTRLRELKTKGRRWSACGSIPDDHQMSKKEALTPRDAIDKSDVPPAIDPSMLAVWGQFLSYEPSIPTLSSVATPSLK